MLGFYRFAEYRTPTTEHFLSVSQQLVPFADNRARHSNRRHRQPGNFQDYLLVDRQRQRIAYPRPTPPSPKLFAQRQPPYRCTFLTELIKKPPVPQTAYIYCYLSI